MPNITQVEKGMLLRLFNRDGYVLNFSTNDFDVFTMECVGVPLCNKYGLSKGKSLTKFVYQSADDLVIKLLIALFDYYEANYETEYTENLDELYSPYNPEYSRLYLKCKSIIARIKGTPIPLSPVADDLKKKFSSEYLSKQIDIMLTMCDENPTEAIGKSKELIESCCITILDDRNIQWDKNWSIPQLANKTMESLKLTPYNVPDTSPAATAIKGILGNLRAIASNIATLRNPYGSGHGKNANYKGLQPRHAKLAVGSSITFVQFIWDTHERQKSAIIRG